MGTVINLANAGAVKRSVLEACRRLGLCEQARRDSVNRAMHALRCGASPAKAVSCGRDMARALARAADMLRPDGAA